MEIFYANNKKYIFRCPECLETIKFKIDFDNLNIEYICKNRLNKNNILYDIFKNHFINLSETSQNYYYKCFKSLDYQFNNYYCQICNKLYCL